MDEGKTWAVDVEVRSSRRIENFGGAADADFEVVWASLAYADAAECRNGWIPVAFPTSRRRARQ